MGIIIYAAVVTVALVVVLVLWLYVTPKKRQAKEESEKRRLEIMFSQIKPHFIYNVLNTIYYLCEKDPETAQEAIASFSDYLRANLDTLSADVCIPFSQEMHQIENYLHLEKLRFGDDLTIEYDIQTKDFVVPALSIQPLVENAVKHGVQGSEDGGTVRISTLETDKEFQVVITDTGVGYNPHKKKDDKSGRSHVGLGNVRERLRIMLNAVVDIYTQEGKGTKVTVHIPKQNSKK